MNTVTDWKGNEIKPGIEVCLIKIIDRQNIITGALVPDGKGGYSQVMEGIKPDRPCWEPQEYFKVKEDMTYDIICGDCTITMPLRLWDFAVDKECIILAIKGISDKPDP